jgi:hypothetical protein
VLRAAFGRRVAGLITQKPVEGHPTGLVQLGGLFSPEPGSNSPQNTREVGRHVH